MILYGSSIDMSTALVSRFDDISIVHEPESDGLHMLATSLTLMLKLIVHKKNTKAEVLGLISEYCFGTSSMDGVAEGSEIYLEYLVDQGIIKRI